MAAEVVDRLGLGDDVELAALVELHGDVAGRLEPGRRTWLLVLRTPLATARTLPWCSVISTTMRSASPSL